MRNPALSVRSNQREQNRQRNWRNIVELFKLHLGNLQPERRPKLSVDYRKAITDYLREIGKVSKWFNYYPIVVFDDILILYTVYL